MSSSWTGLSFDSHRSPVISTRAMVSCTQPLAAEAGLQVLRAGGNAADACVAIAACMNVCEPTSTGIGGDCFALWYDPCKDPTRVRAMNGSGRSSQGLSLETAISGCFPDGIPEELEHDELLGMPSTHANCVTVPGTAAGWVDCLSAWGSMPLDKILQPAIELCDRGVPVPPITARMWQGAEKHLLAGPYPSAMLLADHSLEVDRSIAGSAGSRPQLRAPRAGEIHKKPDLARTFRLLAERGRDGFYRGEVAEAIEAVVRGAGGALTAADLAEHATEFCDPISVLYTPVLPSEEAAHRVFGPRSGRRFPAAAARVFECPPNGQGITALLGLQIQEAVLRGDPGAAEELAGSAADAAEAACGGAGGGGERVAEAAEAVVASARVAEGFSAAGDPSSWFTPLSTASMHVQIEAMRLAFADSRWLVRDPSDAFAGPKAGAGGGGKSPAVGSSGTSVAEAEWAALLRPEYARARSRLIARAPCTAAVDVRRGSPFASCDTVSFSVVDSEGRACSFIQSNYAGFGTNLIPDGWGFTLQNRGANFCLREGSPNCVGPRKRPYHTIIPGMALQEDLEGRKAGGAAAAAPGRSVASTGGDGGSGPVADSRLLYNFSCMGGFMQPQGHLQLLTNLLEHGMDPQAALDAPRFCIPAGRANVPKGGSGGVLPPPVALEAGVPDETVSALAAAGHRVEVVKSWDRSVFGRGQIIWRDEQTGSMWGGSDPRGDGLAIGY